MASKQAVGRSKLDRMISLRSMGETIVQTAWALGLVPWQVGYLTRLLKVCVSTEDHEWLQAESVERGFKTVGEFVMDVFWASYAEYYVTLKTKKKAKKAAA